MANRADQLTGIVCAMVPLSASQPSSLKQTATMLQAHGATVVLWDADEDDASGVNEFPTELLREFTGQLLTGMLDAVIFRTGAGVTRFLQTASRQHNTDRVIDALRDTPVIAASVGAANALRDAQVEPVVVAGRGEKGEARLISWRRVLIAIDRHFQPRFHTGNPMLNLTIGLERSGDWFSLSSGLEARGANVVPVSIFAEDWRVKENRAIGFFEQIEARDIHVLVFNDPAEVAKFAFLAHRFSRARLTNHLLDHHIVIAFGEDTQEVLIDRGVSVDLMTANSSPVTESAIEQISKSIPQLQSRKQNSFINMSGPSTSTNDPNAPWYNSPFMRACRGEPTDVTPIWMMRQAGRYMAEYREVRAKISFLDLCANPQLCSEVMCTAVEKLGVDAAIIFSDLLPILVPMGCDLEFVKGDGPVIHNPVRTAKDVDRIVPLESNAELEFVMETVRQTRQDLPADMPLIGFAGAPFTLASYMIEGGASRNYAATKQLMFSDHAAWDQLMEHLVSSISIYINGQIDAGAQCIQLFDSWAGCLSFEDYSKKVHPYVQKIIASVPTDVPVINFATGNPALLPLLADTRASVIGIDWRTRLDDAWQTVGFDRAVQGNLDPTVLLTNPQEIRQQAKFILDQAAGRAGHIFNLGHGILPMTPVENAIALVDAVHELSSK